MSLNMRNTVELIKKQIEYYPDLEIQDLLKAIYQSVFGCGHFVYDEDRCRRHLYAELDSVIRVGNRPTDELGDYCRVHLSQLEALNITPEMLLRLFVLSARKEEREGEYIDILRTLPEMCTKGILPFEADNMIAAIEVHIAEGCLPFHHSDSFSRSYKPAYRVIRREYAELITLISDLEGLLKKKKAPVIAIDGSCASGKSSLARMVGEIFKADVIHMDDYFLPFDRRTPERMSEAGGNIDHERFLAEVLLPLSRGEEYISRPYRCHGGYYEEPQIRKPSTLTIVEGSYSMHPELERYYDLKILMSCDKEEQTVRLELRNPELLDRFISVWIPLENRYFEGTNIEKRCDIIIKSDNSFKYTVTKRLSQMR